MLSSIESIPLKMIEKRILIKIIIFDHLISNCITGRNHPDSCVYHSFNNTKIIHVLWDFFNEISIQDDALNIE